MKNTNAAPKKMTKTILILILSIIFLIVSLSINVFSWVLSNKKVVSSSNEIYAINQGFSNNISSFANNSDAEFDAAVSNIFNSSDSERYETIIPGDEVYYSFYAVIRNQDLQNGILQYQVDLSITGEAKQGAPAGTGDYISFLQNCRIQANRARIIVLRKNGNSESFTHIKYYADASNGGVLTQKDNNDENYDEENDTLYSYFDYNGGVAPSLVNSSVSTFCNGNTAEAIGASFNITIPNLAGNVPIANEEGVENVYIMIFIPIWYYDTGANQNHEMNSILKITGCTIIPIEN